MQHTESTSRGSKVTYTVLGGTIFFFTRTNEMAEESFTSKEQALHLVKTYEKKELIIRAEARQIEDIINRNEI